MSLVCLKLQVQSRSLNSEFFRRLMFNLSVGDGESLSPPRASTPQPGFIVEKETCMPNFELKGSECVSMSSWYVGSVELFIRERAILCVVFRAPF